MVDAPRQDWQAYDSLTGPEGGRWLRQLLPADRFAIYCDAFNLIWEQRRNIAELPRLEQWNWSRKVAQRRILLQAFTRFDQYRCGQAAANNAR